MSTGLERSKRKPQCRVLVPFLLKNDKLPRTSVGLSGLIFKMKPPEVACMSNSLCFQLGFFFFFHWCATVNSGWLCHRTVSHGVVELLVLWVNAKETTAMECQITLNIKSIKILSVRLRHTHTRTHTQRQECTPWHADTQINNCRKNPLK